LDEEILYKKSERRIFLNQPAQFIKDIEHQPKNEQRGDDKDEGQED
jgi:hypothetical protein